MPVHQEVLEVMTRKPGLTDVTNEVSRVVSRSRIETGLCSVFIQHTSASLVVQENADPTVLSDLEAWMNEVVPENRSWEHDAEGPDDMPAHAKSAITKTSETVPVSAGRLHLGTWQALYVWEHRTHPHARRLVVTVIG